MGRAGPLVTLGIDLVVGSAPPSKAGSAAAISETSNEFGFALGIAILGSIGTAVYRTQIAGAVPSGVPAAAAQSARDTLAGATVAAGDLPGQVAAALLDLGPGGLHQRAARHRRHQCHAIEWRRSATSSSKWALRQFLARVMLLRTTGSRPVAPVK